MEAPLLFDYNLKLIKIISRFLNLPEDKIKLLSEYDGLLFEDYRNTISPQLITNHSPLITPYSQPFSDRLGFTPNLSIIDLVFNEGRQAGQILRQS